LVHIDDFEIGGAIVASPMAYQIDGRQYLIVPVQDVIYAFALPEGLAAGDRVTAR
jgi:hypothetical protein